MKDREGNKGTVDHAVASRHVPVRMTDQRLDDIPVHACRAQLRHRWMPEAVERLPGRVSHVLVRVPGSEATPGRRVPAAVGLELGGTSD